ncbi:MAG: DNA primase [Verrucomicrobiia bacterium]
MGALIPPTIIEQIRSANDIVEVIGGYLRLKRSGAGFFALCPFHKEKTPSFYVNPQRQVFHCFGCHKGGNVFTFIMEYENVSFVEAVKMLAERAHIQIHFEDVPVHEKQEKELLYEIHEQITRRWHSCLLNESAGAVARDYLKKRGVSEEAIKIFRLGYAPESWDDTVNWGTSKGYPPETLEKAGLIVRRDESKTSIARTSDNFYDRFRGRLIFPICDEQGRVVAFSGRILNENEKIAKYLNSPETAIFIKSKIFYGLDKSKKAILDAGYAIVCEGQLDLITCYMSGIKNIVAPQGTAFTEEHSRILKRYTDEVVLCFDSDNAGQQAAIRTAPILFSYEIAVKVAVIPEPDDPDSFIKTYGTEKFLELIRDSRQFFDFYLDRLCKLNNPQTDKGKMTVMREFGTALKKIQNATIIDTYKTKLAARLGVSRTAVDEEFKKISIQPQTQNWDVQVKIDKPAPSKDELWLLKIAILKPETIHILNDYLDTNWIQDERLRIIFEKLVHQIPESFDVSRFMEEFEDTGIVAIISESAIDSGSIPEPEKQARDIVLKLRNKSISQHINTLNNQLNQDNIDEETRFNLLREKLRLQKAHREPLRKKGEA